MNPYIGEKEIVEFTRDLVRSPSVNPPANTSKCARIVLKKFRENGIDAEIIEGKKGACNIVARLPGKNKGKVLLLNGHIDVVPPDEGWTVDPFGGEIRDGKIFGRGSSDMKSGIAAVVAAMIGFKRSGSRFNGEIVFTGVADEETGSEFGTVYLLKNSIGKNADFAIVSEPTNLMVKLGNRGLRWIDIVVRGKASHAGKPHLGINALSYGAKLIDAIDSMEFTRRNDAFEIPIPTIAVTMISGGIKANVIPDRCELALDRRMIPGETTETVIRELKDIINPILEKEKGLEIDVKVRPSYWSPYLISEKEPIVQACVESFKKVTGEEPKIGAESACTDASHVFHFGGIPTLIFGPGNENLAHGPDEYVEIKDIVLSTQVFMSIFNDLLLVGG
jgi:acetylornithine deacetylase/succinyl-diaminopimelate desuccinylase family protein